MPPAGSEPRRAPAGTRVTHCGEGFGIHQRPTSGVVGVQAAVGWRSPWGEQSLPRPTRVHGHHASFIPESGLLNAQKTAVDAEVKWKTGSSGHEPEMNQHPMISAESWVKEVAPPR